MVGGTQQQQQPQSQPLQIQLPQSAATSTAEEEFLKRNTDCVYFLASPLTCKKGSECEYRHSDIARVNPRDCWFWLNGNCLNPKCAFRHPPLDGLLGAEVSTPVGPSVSQLETHAPYGMGKQGVSCIFFQKGFCLKGDRCPYLHGPNLGNHKVAQSAAATPVTESPTLKKGFGGLDKSTQEQKAINVPKYVELPPQGKPVAKVEAAPARNGVVIGKNIPPPPSLGGDEFPRYRPSSVPPAMNEISTSRPNRVYQAHASDNDSVLNGKDADEFSREPSPGFDVLVDDELRDSDYYPNEEHFGRSRGPMNDYDLGRSTDYNSMTDVDRDMYRDPRDYDSYERLQGQYALEEHRASSERILGGSAHIERRRYPRAGSPDQIDESDLRHRISKQRRGGNGLRSVISREHTRESRAEERNNRAPRRDSHHVPMREGFLSSRLRGRIKIPGRSTSPVNENDMLVEREMDMGRHQARFSLGRPQIPSNQGRLRDRIKGRASEDFIIEARDFRGPRIRRDIIIDNDTEFTGPKRLAELKSGRNADSYEQQTYDQQSLGKRKYPKMESHQQCEDDLSFEGPKPLSEILKRKRGAETTLSESGITSGNNEGKNQKEGEVSLIGSSVYTDKGESNPISSDLGGAGKQAGLSNPEKVKSTDGHSSLHDLSELENEEGLVDDDAMDDQEHEAYDHVEGEEEGYYDYEQVDGEDYNLDEGETGDPEEEYIDEDDGDDFAKKMGVVL